MILEIDDYKTLEDLQDKFSRCYPNLKIEFGKHRHHWQEASPSSDFYDPKTQVGAVRKVHDCGTMNISSRERVGEVEKRFSREFGLNAQIFFKGDGRWIQTAHTDFMSLAALQNRPENRASQMIL